MLPALVQDPRVELVAAADPREEARRRFEQDFKGNAYPSLDKLCSDGSVEAVYVATPHEMHAEHVKLCARHGKHILVEKPLAITLDECRSMVDAARKAGVQLVVGHSHSFDAPVLLARKLIDGGEFGAVRMITAIQFTDFMYRPRRPEELDTSKGGGVVFSQGAHQVDVVRLLAGSRVKSVRAMARSWDPSRRTEGAYSCFLEFGSGACATLAYSGYAHFDSDEFMGWIAESGHPKDPGAHGAARKALKEDEAELKMRRNFGGADYSPAKIAPFHQHFGVVIVSCEKADLRLLPGGVMVYADGAQRLEALAAPQVHRKEVIDELYGAVVEGRAPLHDGEWAYATMQACLAILESSRTGREILLT
jgi:phthalate 4,5-cis-dihydrodiol dehydrogenase